MSNSTHIERTVHQFEDMEVRSSGTGRTIVGIAVPFDREAVVGTRVSEVFRRGAFAKTVSEGNPSRVKLYALHNDAGALPLGAAKVLREDTAGLHVEMQVGRTQAGEEALSLVNDGILDSFSVGFIPVRPGPRAPVMGGLIERREVRLMEVSLVAHPAYEDARILQVREAAEAEAPSMTLAQARLLSTRIRANTPDVSGGR